MTILVSACLLGQNCKYSGGSNYCPAVLDFVQGHRVIPVCPEVLGGLPTPRSPAEIVAGQVINRDGVSVDREFRTGAAKALEIAREQKADLAILQSRSPSCGVKEIYDGSFTGRKIPGQGVFAALLQEGRHPRAGCRGSAPERTGMMVLYFSGTGNSRYIAAQIAQALCVPTLDLNGPHPGCGHLPGADRARISCW